MQLCVLKLSEQNGHHKRRILIANLEGLSNACQENVCLHHFYYVIAKPQNVAETAELPRWIALGNKLFYHILI